MWFSYINKIYFTHLNVSYAKMKDSYANGIKQLQTLH